MAYVFVLIINIHKSSDANYGNVINLFLFSFRYIAKLSSSRQSCLLGVNHELSVIIIIMIMIMYAFISHLEVVTAEKIAIISLWRLYSVLHI